MKHTPQFTRNEMTRGAIAMVLSTLLIPELLALIPGLEGLWLSLAASAADGIVVVVFFRRFMQKNVLAALDRPFPTLYFAVLGYLANLAFEEITYVLLYPLLPEYQNLNTQTILGWFSTNLDLVVIATVVVAPITEELLFRGLLFRMFHDQAPKLAWVISVASFAMIHVIGYLLYYSPLEFAISFLSYIPAGIILCVTYRRSGNIISPILAHSFINLSACIAALR